MNFSCTLSITTNSPISSEQSALTLAIIFEKSPETTCPLAINKIHFDLFLTIWMLQNNVQKSLNICLNININMTTKTITVTEDAYESLKGLKKEGESFSDVLLRIGEKKCTVDSFFGLLTGDVAEARENTKKWREDFSKDAEKRHKLLFGHQRS